MMLSLLASLSLAPLPAAALAQAPPRALPPRPRLVVMITVDQLRPDYLDRWRAQLRGGFATLLAEGAVFARAFQDHAVTETAPGHATVLSGRWPAHTGIASNAAGVQDSAAPLLEVAGPGASPRRFRGTAFFDWLRARDPGARALSVSRKDRGAILPIGRAQAHVYWYQSGIFTTSRYYADSLPAWVRAFNARRIPFKAAETEWRPLLSDSAYPEPDDQPWENGGRQRTFPYTLPADSTRAALAFAGVPAMDSLTLAFALAGAEALRLGRRAESPTDLLAVGLSATDAVGHTFGPDSREVHDQVLRLDRYLGWFLRTLVRRYGRDRLVVALTADHGVTPFPEASRARGHAAATRVALDTLIAAVNRELRPVGGGEGDGASRGQRERLDLESGMVFLGGGAVGDSLLTAVAARIRAVPGVARVDRPDDLARADTAADAVARRWRHHLPAGAGVGLVVTLDPLSVWDYLPIAMHGNPSDFDAHVPLLLWGAAIRRGAYERRVATVDIAPTLARLLRLEPSEPLDGRVLSEALWLRNN